MGIQKNIFSVFFCTLGIVTFFAYAQEAQTIRVTTYYPSPNVKTLSLIVQDMEVRKTTETSMVPRLEIPVGGVFYVDSPVAGSAFRIDSAGVSFSENAYVHETIGYQCVRSNNNRVCSGNVTTGNLTPRSFNGNASYLRLNGIALHSMPVLVLNEEGNTRIHNDYQGMQNATNTLTNTYPLAQDACAMCEMCEQKETTALKNACYTAENCNAGYINADRNFDLAACLNTAKTIATNTLGTLTYTNAQGRFSNKKGIFRMTKTGEYAFGGGVGVGIGGHFGAGVGALFGTNTKPAPGWLGFIPTGDPAKSFGYKTFQYQTKDPQ